MLPKTSSEDHYRISLSHRHANLAISKAKSITAKKSNNNQVVDQQWGLAKDCQSSGSPSIPHTGGAAMDTLLEREAETKADLEPNGRSNKVY
jgi:hypothetical protein